MDHKEAYHSVSYHYSTKMMRTSLAIGVVWGVASLCLAIITGLVFMQVIDYYRLIDLFDLLGSMDRRHRTIKGSGKLWFVAMVFR